MNLEFTITVTEQGTTPQHEIEDFILELYKKLKCMNENSIADPNAVPGESSHPRARAPIDGRYSLEVYDCVTELAAGIPTAARLAIRTTALNRPIDLTCAPPGRKLALLRSEGFFQVVVVWPKVPRSGTSK